MVVTAAALLAFGIPLSLALARLYRDDAADRVERDANRAAAHVSTAAVTSPTIGASALSLGPADPGAAVALYDGSGRLLQGDGPGSPDAAVHQALSGHASDTSAGALVAAVPVMDAGNVVAVVRAALPASVVDGQAHRAWSLMALLAVVVAGGAAAAARWQARRLAAPVAALAAAVTRLGHGDFGVRAPHSTIEELDDAASALNATAVRLRDALEAERAFSTHASHQLRTPLTALRMRLEGAGSRRTDLRAAVEDALTEVDRLERTVEDLLGLARGTVERTTVELAGLLAEVERSWRGPLAAEGRALVVHGGEGIGPAQAAEAAVRQILEVLLANAAQHGAGTVTVHARARPPGVAIDVGDEGPVPSATDEVLFARGLSPPGGTGLGLALARALAEAEGGRLVLDRRGPHTCFTLLLLAQPTRSAAVTSTA